MAVIPSFCHILRRIDEVVMRIDEWAWRRWSKPHPAPHRCLDGWHCVGPTGLCTKCGEEP